MTRVKVAQSTLPFRRIKRFVYNVMRYYELYGLGSLAQAGQRRLLKLIYPVAYRGAVFRFQARNFLLHSRPLRMQVGDVCWLMMPKGTVAFEFWTGTYFERNELGFVLRCLRQGMTFMDVGSNVGLFALAGAKRLEQLGGGVVYAVEPSTWSFGVLQENVRLNHLTNVFLYRTAFGDYTGEAVLKLNVPWKDALNTLGEPSHPNSQVIGYETVPITTIDAFIEANHISKVDLMKVDVEGAELLVFKGAENLLRRPDAPLIVYESSPLTAGFNYHPVEVMWFLQDYGYQFFMLDPTTGHVLPRKPGHGYDGTIVVARPSHFTIISTV